MPILFTKLPSMACKQPNNFTISVPEETLQELKQLVALAKLGL
jgi:hypothetical protein